MPSCWHLRIRGQTSDSRMGEHGRSEQIESDGSKYRVNSRIMLCSVRVSVLIRFLIDMNLQVASRLAHAESELLAIRKLMSPCTCYQTAHHTASPPLASNHPSPSLLSKLYLHVAALYESAMSLALTASTKAGVRIDSAPASSATENGKKNGTSSRSLKQKLTGRSSNSEEAAASGKVSSSFVKYLLKAGRGSRARAYFWLGVDRGERGQFGEALSFLKMASDELDVSSSGKRITLQKSDKAKEEKKEFAKDKEDLLVVIGHYSASYKQLNDTVAFQPVQNISSLSSQIPMGRSATQIKTYVAPVPVFGPSSVDAVASGVHTLHTGREGDVGEENAVKSAYY